MIQLKKVINPLDKKWEFETNQGYLADAFLQILEAFYISTEDIYIPSFLDMSQIEFRTTRKKRLQIEYVYRRFVNKNFWKMNQSLTEFEGGDWFAIY